MEQVLHQRLDHLSLLIHCLATAVVALFVFILITVYGKRRSLGSGASITLRDTQGRERGYIGESKEGAFGLSLMDKDGNSLVFLGEQPDGASGLAFLDSHGKQRACLMTEASGEPCMVLSDETEEPRLQLAVSQDGEASVRIGSPDGSDLQLGTSDNGPMIAIGINSESEGTVLTARGLTAVSGNAMVSVDAEEGEARVVVGRDDASGTVALHSTGGHPNIQFVDAEGTLRCALQLHGEKGPRIFLGGEDGTGHLNLAVGEDGPYLNMEGGPQIHLAVSDGRPRLTFTDESGTERCKIGLTAENTPGIYFGRGADHPSALIAMLDNQPAIAICGDGTHVRCRIGLDEAGAPLVELLDKEGRIRAGLGMPNEQPMLIITDEDGDSVFVAP